MVEPRELWNSNPSRLQSLILAKLLLKLSGHLRVVSPNPDVAFIRASIDSSQGTPEPASWTTCVPVVYPSHFKGHYLCAVKSDGKRVLEAGILALIRPSILKHDYVLRRLDPIFDFMN